MSWVEQIESWDQQLFLLLNGQHNAFFDVVMYWVTNKYVWIPFYLLLLFLLQRKYGWKALLFALPAIALLITMTDQTTNLLKHGVGRYRPCHNLDIQSMVHLVVDSCRGKYTFVSGHSSNSFAIATFMGMLFRHSNKKWLWGLWLWAALVAYSRIYVGVHYPIDIACGALLGIAYGLLIYKGYTYLLKRQNLYPV